ncbi:MAG: glycosyl transferase [Bryobacterales bacterium]|nr:glycosyl transferase [Bryobacterales bacterium]
MSTPLVSILIPAYQVASYIGETLESVFSQQFPGAFEVILVNDGSPDSAELEKAIAPYRDRIVYHVQPNGGPSVARNTAFRLSRAPYIALLDGDDAYLPDYLQVQTEQLADNPAVALVYGDMEVFGGSPVDGRRLSDLNKETEAPSLVSLLHATATVINTPMIRREAIIHAGGWDETSFHCEDYDLWLRIALQGKLKRHPRVVARYRLRGGSLSGSTSKMCEGRMKAYHKLLDNSACPRALVPLVQERITITQGDIALARGKEAFRDQDFQLAATHLDNASKYKKKIKLSLVAILLRLVPKLLYSLARLRARVFTRYPDA